MVEWFIAPVLKTGDPSRGPGVRIPPPLQVENQLKLKAQILYEFWLFSFYPFPKYSKSLIPKVPVEVPLKFLKVTGTESAKSA